MMDKRKKKTINQILVTESIIVTPELKRKRKIYKVNFFLSCFLACTLFSACIYAEYDRSKSEQVSQDILLAINDDPADETTISVEEGVIIVNALADGRDGNEEVNIANIENSEDKSKITESIAPDGKSYYSEAILKIPSLGIEYPVLSSTSDELLKISLNKIHGPDPNDVGNYCIAGHNYKSGKMFGKLPGISMDATIELTDLSGRCVTYKVYDKYVVDDTDVACTSQLTNGKREVTLITCTSTGKQRHIIKARAI